MVSLHTLRRTTKRSLQRVGRGQSSGRGKTSGRGTKGQNARSGRKKRPEWRDIIKKLPKRRGYGKNRGRTVVARPRSIAISLQRLSEVFENNATVTKKALEEKGLVRGKERCKIVGGGTISKKLSISGCVATASAKAAIEKAGGTVA
ncbi:50S ribosomal protein L15 [Candidatus Kaiserbacteria bacterium]|nr:50S ribosomal protein L15 [Candidatus Kaiserbacteria bacterium]